MNRDCSPELKPARQDAKILRAQIDALRDVAVVSALESVTTID